MMFESLQEHGFYIIDNVKSLSDALNLTEALGRILPLNGKDTQILQPKNKLSSNFKSLSYFYGFDSFPLHTDTTFWSIPARYIIFFLKEKVDTGTVLSKKSNSFDNKEICK
ncbi:unnamed protein product [Commensalibacter communis]|uniref:TauD/TfdA-like domain-containing protein n=1 Tax=Commensalibacter communis TaxID=2972786 RepID=A0A9W4TPL6_9PROT|nr:TauD/TfdA family dioxygenase [Commensalibacter communis]CAI3949928.1 unnamed protein product [Commensalibacter communis]CAI3949975.1 unnamed protein product [Commensalibacter communis]CAI3953096.1 unnamed protein product [Commensalibacter communis]CAI3954241.1 unnamed protein product [Commensalibacter communis]